MVIDEHRDLSNLKLENFNHNLFLILGRTSMHIAILKEHEDMVDYIGKSFRQTLKIGDNVSELH